MKTRTITVYSFDELDERAKERAIEKLFNINVDFEWWETTYEDAKNIGLVITEFDIDRGNMIRGKLITSLEDVIDAILTNHGDVCETFKTATRYKKDFDALFAKDNLLPEDDQRGYDFENEVDDLEEEFRKEILEDYLTILRQEFEYLTSKEAIIETIKCNEYEFNEDGNLI